jgi:hypothetical protein
MYLKLKEVWSEPEFGVPKVKEKFGVPKVVKK